MARPATTRYAILGMLTRRPMTGYDLREEISESVGHFWTESFGQLYPTLRELAAEGLVRARASGPRRRVEYTLTDAGRSTLRSWLAEDVELYSSQRNELLLKLFFGRHAAPGVIRGHLEGHVQALESTLTRYRSIERAVREETVADRPYWLVTVRYGIAMVEASLDWTRQTLASLATHQHAHEDAEAEERP